jgi:hypothetical protein
MSKCEYCNGIHEYNTICPPNRRDKLHNNKSLDLEAHWRQPSFGQRLRDGFVLLHEDDNLIVDKFGNTRGSGNY